MNVRQAMTMEKSSEAAATWFVIVGGAEAGPYTNSVIQLYLEIGELSLDDMCWREGFPEWISLGRTVEFAPHQSSEPSIETPAEPASPSEAAEVILPSSPVLQNERNKQPQSENYLARLWRGEISLPDSHWVRVYSLTALPIVLGIGLWQADFTSQPSRTSPVVVNEGIAQPIGPPEVKTAVAIAIKKPSDILETRRSDVEPPAIKLAAIQPLAIKPLDIRPLDVAEGMRAISAVPIYAAIKEKYPAEYPKMEGVLRDGFLKGWSAHDHRAKILPFLTAYYQRSLPTASPATIEKFLRIVAAEQEAILQANAASCTAYMKGDASGYSTSDIPPELTARELEIGAEIIRSSGEYKGPAIKESEIQTSMSRVVSGASRSLGMPVAEYVKGLNFMLDGTANCEVFIAFYKHLADVTSAEKPKLLRFIVQSIMLPKA